jgi:uncharacterized YccA/Bax inhibitor family protein
MKAIRFFLQQKNQPVTYFSNNVQFLLVPQRINASYFGMLDSQAVLFTIGILFGYLLGSKKTRCA